MEGESGRDRREARGKRGREKVGWKERVGGIEEREGLRGKERTDGIDEMEEDNESHQSLEPNLSESQELQCLFII